MNSKEELDDGETKLNGQSTKKSALPMDEMDLDGLDADCPTSSVQKYVTYIHS